MDTVTESAGATATATASAVATAGRRCLGRGQLRRHREYVCHAPIQAINGLVELAFGNAQ